MPHDADECDECGRKMKCIAFQEYRCECGHVMSYTDYLAREARRTQAKAKRQGKP